MDIIFNLMRWISYWLLLVISGAFILDYSLATVVSAKSQQTKERLLIILMKSLIVASLLSLFLQAILWINSFGTDSISLLWESRTGIVLLILFVASMLVTLFSSNKVKTILLIVMLITESTNGHASESSVTIIFDFIHLLAIASWLGGVFYLALNARDGRKAVLSFLEQYVKIVWVSIALVSISGILLTWMILPNVSYLIYTTWGKLLLIKIVLVISAIGLGYTAKSYFVKVNSANGTPKALFAEIIGLTIVILLTSIISSIDPTPSDKNALYYHEMGEEIHYTVEMYPNAPGPNHFVLSIWSLVDEGDIHEVMLALVDTQKKSQFERVYHLEKQELTEFIEFPGFVESSYGLEQLSVPYPANWNATITVTFTDGFVRTFDFKLVN